MEKGTKEAVVLYMNVISQNLRKLRGTMSQADFAKKVGVSRTTVHRIESRRNFKVDSLLQIAFSFGLAPYELCLTEEERQKLRLRSEVLVESFKEDLKKDIIAELKK
jgi:DNA-binding XRE family transcriptional regulator